MDGLLPFHMVVQPPSGGSANAGAGPSKPAAASGRKEEEEEEKEPASAGRSPPTPSSLPALQLHQGGSTEAVCRGGRALGLAAAAHHPRSRQSQGRNSLRSGMICAHAT